MDSALSVLSNEDGTIEVLKDPNTGLHWVNATAMCAKFKEKNLDKFFSSRKVKDLSDALFEEIYKTPKTAVSNNSNEKGNLDPKSLPDFPMETRKRNGFEGLVSVSDYRGPKSVAVTWMVDDLAIKLAEWISPKFGAWATRAIKTLLRDGQVTIGSTNSNKIPYENLGLVLAAKSMLEQAMIDYDRAHTILRAAKKSIDTATTIMNQASKLDSGAKQIPVEKTVWMHREVIEGMDEGDDIVRGNRTEKWRDPNSGTVFLFPPGHRRIRLAQQHFILGVPVQYT